MKRLLIAFAMTVATSLPAWAATRVLVLPFQTPPQVPEVATLGPGTMDSLITAFIRVPEYIVVDRATTDQLLKEQALQQTGLIDEASAMQIGKLMGVQAIISGHIQLVGDRVRISANFVEAETGRVRRSEHVTGALAEVFDLQDQLASRFISDQGIPISSQTAKRVTQAMRATADRRAYDFYQRGRGAYLQASRMGMIEAIQWFDEAIKLDPRYALAYAGKAEAQAAQGWLKEKNHEAYELNYLQAKATAQKALDLQEELPEAHRALAMALTGLKDPSRQRYGERAVQLAPNDAESWMALWFTKYPTNPDAPEILRSLELNPRLITARLTRGIALGYKVRLTEAFNEGTIALKLNPNSDSAHFFMGAVLYQKGKTKDAIAEYRRAIELNPDFAAAQNFLGEALLSSGQVAAAITAFEAALKTSPDYYDARQNLYKAKRRNNARE